MFGRTEYIIKKATLEDIEAVKEIEILSGLSSWSINEYAKEIERPDSIFLVARNNEEQVLGFLLSRLITLKQLTLIETEAEIYNIAVKKAYRKKGIASELIKEMFRIGRLYNLKKVFLEVRISNTKAIAFYRRHRFEIIGRRKNFYTNPTEDAWLMSIEPDQNKKTLT